MCAARGMSRRSGETYSGNLSSKLSVFSPVPNSPVPTHSLTPPGSPCHSLTSSSFPQVWPQIQFRGLPEVGAGSCHCPPLGRDPGVRPELGADGSRDRGSGHGHGAGIAEHARHPAACSPPSGPSWGHEKAATWTPTSHAVATESARAPAGHRKRPSPNCILSRKAKMDITFGPLTSPALGLEPVVLGDVRRACTLRTQFLQNLLIPQAKGGSIPSPQDDHFGTSYQQWLSSVETLLTNHPPSHVLAALEHLATEREAEIRSLCSQDRLQDTKMARCQVPDQSDSSQALPSVMHLIQEGWQTVSVLVTQRGPLLKEHHILTQRLQSLLEEVERCALGANERQALVLGLQGYGLWAELKALCAHSQELEEAVGRQQLLLQELQAKQQRILHWRQLVGETQEQVRLLIKSNSASKTHLCRSPGEVLALIQRKVVPTSEAVAPQSQELLRCLEEAAQHLPHLLLGTLLRHSPGGLQPLPTVLPSIHQLHPASSRGSSLIVLSHILGLPTGKAPELLLPKAASLRQDLLFFQDQCNLRCWDLLHMKNSLPPGPSTQELLQIHASQEKEQKENLGQALKQLENLLEQALERIPKLQGIVGDWWDQPGQVTLSGELCQGLSLPQWRLRWAQAQGILQQLCR
ncbi:HAUS augmin-like complex subunit 5 isoform X2 [Myotis myotis]|uniref:HAUS augmin-like complex subunit 5 isoform X2 n=1 Tax=Myotis myotis TaxID=51298 RepID=UPI0017488FDD|nr:HAUS augmin-like complex subunit 5 isoform X2 [Myotis myotis]